MPARAACWSRPAACRPTGWRRSPPIEAGDLALGFRGQVLAAEERQHGSPATSRSRPPTRTRIAALAGLAPPLRLDGLPVAGTLRFTAGERQRSPSTGWRSARRQRGAGARSRLPRPATGAASRRDLDDRRANRRQAAGAAARSAAGRHRRGRSGAVGPAEPLAGRAVRRRRARRLRGHIKLERRASRWPTAWGSATPPRHRAGAAARST